ncbi:SDR family NAD(P)-dependent oxidoreductase [Granulicoccus phenolivorans]|uniref:SDR family NAD(P)-dependent oxidoreductase n=1 Tax=Granulicoccus phenolivorans TaxID=266854 RepID=UPI00047A037B|nr:SDR family NAD(P)-dependent oxidoreductase [Granulicoccus phenolivorans]
MTTALITGATRGLGRETARRLAALGWTVWLGARDPEAGDTVAIELTHAYPAADLRVVPLDVTDDTSVTAAVRTVAEADTGLDALINNAGIGGRPVPPRECTPADFIAVYGVNVLGPVRVTSAFLPLLDRSAAPRLVMVSSGVGSLTHANDAAHVYYALDGLAYPSSKTALNMITTQYAKALPHIRVCAVDPGWTATDFTDHRGTQTVQQGTDAIVQAVTADSIPGMFFGRDGNVPW